MNAASPWTLQGGDSVVSVPRIAAGTTQQAALWDTLNGSGANVLVEARAGSGKSSSCREGMFRMLDADRDLDIRYTVFNKQNADEFRSSCPPGVAVGTCHSLGLQVLRRARPAIQIDAKKTYMLLDAQADGLLAPRWRRRAVSSLVSLAKNLALRPSQSDLAERLDQIAEHYDVRLFGRRDEVIDLAIRVLKASADRLDCADFDDMLWLPSVLSLDPLPAATTFIDEVQDFNPAQHELIPYISGGGRVVAVGDRHQAIYAFRGADPDSMPRLGKSMEASSQGLTRHDLTVTFRCPKSHVALAQAYVPDIQAHASNHEGEIEVDLSPVVAMVMAMPGDMVLCPTNAPLIRAALSLIRDRRRCAVRGRAIGDSLLAVYRTVRGDSVLEKAKFVGQWEHEEINRLAARDGTEDVIESVRDRAASLQAVISACISTAQVETLIGSLFTEDSPSDSVVVFSTIHRAKGLEAERVWLLEQEPDGRSRSLWQHQQECNLRYVALTRSKQFLGLVNPK